MLQQTMPVRHKFLIEQAARWPEANDNTTPGGDGTHY